jgi:hypothetical protein
MATAVSLELGSKRVFACSLDWPGWCRSGKSEEEALEALASYARRYAVVAEAAGLRFRPSEGKVLDVIERLPGSATTDFGAPGAWPSTDLEPLRRGERLRLAKLVEASWLVLHRVVAGAPAQLRKGPRGGGRDRDKIVAHVADAEVAYARKLGVREKGAALRPALAGAIASATTADPVVEKGWPVRYAARRVAWHALDHAWEIEDRSDR